MKAPKSELMSRIGVHYIGYVLSSAGVIFRETSSTDVGVDGQLELVSSNGVATGMLSGIQIKSGDSFINIERKIFSFKASKKHFEYWHKFSLPSFGIVYSPTLNIASWFDLTEHSSDILENNKPPIIRQMLSDENIVGIDRGLKYLTDKVHFYHNQPLTLNDVEKLAVVQDVCDDKSDVLKEVAWKRLISAFFSSSSDSEIVGNVGYRLSWYFPTVSEKQKNQFKNRLNQLNLSELDRILQAIMLAFKRDREDVVSHICDLLSYKEDIIKLFVQLETQGLVKEQEQWLLEQVKEYIEQI